VAVFDVVSVAAEQRFHETRGAERVRVALEAYTYGHFPIVAGIIIAAIGVEGVLAHASDSKGLGAFYAVPLYADLALYLAGNLFFKQRVLRARAASDLSPSQRCCSPSRQRSWFRRSQRSAALC